MEINVADRAAPPCPFLPYDVLIRLVAQSTARDIISCSMVSSACSLSLCPFKNFTLGMQAVPRITMHPSTGAHTLQLQWDRGRRCIVDMYFSGDELRRDIARSLAAEMNWRGNRPKCRSVKHVDVFQKHTRIDHSFLQWQSNPVSRRLFLPLIGEMVEQ